MVAGVWGVDLGRATCSVAGLNAGGTAVLRQGILHHLLWTVWWFWRSATSPWRLMVGPGH